MLDTCAARAPTQLTPAPEMFGSGYPSWNFREMELCRVIGIMLFGNGSRMNEFPEARVVAGSKIWPAFTGLPDASTPICGPNRAPKLPFFIATVGTIPV